MSSIDFVHPIIVREMLSQRFVSTSCDGLVEMAKTNCTMVDYGIYEEVMDNITDIDCGEYEDGEIGELRVYKDGSYEIDLDSD